MSEHATHRLTSNYEKATAVFIGLMSKPLVIFAVWIILFLLTLVYSELSWRALLAAFFAWTGGLVTARIDHLLRTERVYRDVSRKISRTRKFNQNVF